MKKEECIKLLTIIKAVFPNFTGLSNEISIGIWYEMIGELDYNKAAVSVKRHLATSKFPPTVNDILVASADISENRIQTSADAWNDVLEAIRKFGVYRVEEGVNSLQEPTRSIMRNQFRETCLSENLMADKAHFLRMYDTYSKRDQTERLLPETLKNEVKSLTDTLAQKMLMDKPNG
jgi:predicted ribosome quality control (RQC) complex YloA/Tae2 family protein